MFQSSCVYRNELSNPRKLDRASFTDYSKATRVRKFNTAYTGVVEINFSHEIPVIFVANTKKKNVVQKRTVLVNHVIVMLLPKVSDVLYLRYKRIKLSIICLNLSFKDQKLYVL